MESFDTDAHVTWEIASQGRRFANYLLDVIGYYVIMFSLGIVLTLAGVVNQSTPQGVFLLLALVVQVLYYTFFEALLFRTPGKMITGTRVMTRDGDNPTFRMAFLRSLSRLVPFEPFSFLGHLNAGWHDQWTGTCVVRRKTDG